MTKFERVKQILDLAVAGGNFAAHGPFWRTQTRDAFVAHVVFGRRLVQIGNGAASNLVKALRGQPPFGSDTGAASALFRRMPAGRPPVPADAIDFIERWIQEGCPDDQLPAAPRFDAEAGNPIDPALHVAFWRDFDNWAMFQATPEIRDAVNAFFSIAGRWMDAAADPAQLPQWEAAIAEPAARESIELLATRQIGTVTDHYGNPVPLLTVLHGFERFGSNRLPVDPERPQDPAHNMNGAVMWFFWSAFADACMRIGVSELFWTDFARAILLGLLHDGLFRGRFPVAGFDPSDPATPDVARAFVRQLGGADVQPELARRFVDSNFGR